ASQAAARPRLNGRGHKREGRRTPALSARDEHHRARILPIDAVIQSNLRETTTRTLASLTPREVRRLLPAAARAASGHDAALPSSAMNSRRLNPKAKDHQLIIIATVRRSKKRPFMSGLCRCTAVSPV